MPKHPKFLGFIDAIFPAKDRKVLVGKLRPLYELSADARGSDQAFADESALRERFPNAGLVTWYDLPTSAQRHSIWLFDCEESPSYQAQNLRHDLFRVSGRPVQPIEILDLRSVGDEEALRQRLTQQGLALPFQPCDRVFLWSSGDLWIGPLQLRRTDGAQGPWEIDPSVGSDTIPRLAALGKVSIIEATLDNHRRLFVPPGAEPPTGRGRVDWSSDDVVLKRAMRWIRSNFREYTDALHMTMRAIDHALERLSEMGRTNDDLHRHQLERARSIVSQLNERHDLLSAIQDDLARLPVVQQLVDGRVAALKEDAYSAVVDSVHKELARERSEITALEKRIAVLQADLQQLEQQGAETRTRAQTEVDRFQVELQDWLSAAKDLPHRVLGQIALLRGALQLTHNEIPAGVSSEAEEVNRPVGRDTQKGPDVPRTRARLQLPEVGPETVDLEDPRDVVRALKEACRTNGLHSLQGMALHASVLAGAFPVLFGDSARDLLQVYANAVTAGRILRLPMSVGMLDPSDLLGRVDQSTRQFLPQPGGLIDVLLGAPQDSHMFLVVLEGINRAAVDAYLMPLLVEFCEALRSGKGTLPLFHPASIEADSPYLAASTLSWPRNVLLAGTLAEGVVAIPPSGQFWTLSTLTYVSNSGVRRAAGGEIGHAGLSSMRPTVLDRFSAESETVRDQQLADLFSEIRESLGTNELRGEDLSARYYRSCMKVIEDEKTAIDLVVSSCLVPQALGSGWLDLLIDKLKRSGRWSPTIESAISSASSILS